MLDNRLRGQRLPALFFTPQAFGLSTTGISLGVFADEGQLCLNNR